MHRAENTAFMLPAAASIHAVEVMLKDTERNKLADQVEQFLKSNQVSVFGIRKWSKEERPAFNDVISIIPERRAAAAAQKEALHAAISELSHIEINGVTIIRSSYEVAGLLRKRGFKLLSPSVKRVAESIGIFLAK